MHMLKSGDVVWAFTGHSAVFKSYLTTYIKRKQIALPALLCRKPTVSVDVLGRGPVMCKVPISCCNPVYEINCTFIKTTTHHFRSRSYQCSLIHWPLGDVAAILKTHVMGLVVEHFWLTWLNWFQVLQNTCHDKSTSGELLYCYQ